jgi:hypothetical protein
MKSHELQELAERLERLERQNYRLRRVVIVTLVGVVAALIAGADGAKVVDAERIILRDKAGKMRALLETDKEGNPSLVLFEANGEAGIRLEVGGEFDSLMSLHSHVGESDLTLIANRFGASHITIDTKDGGSVFLSASGKGENQSLINLGGEAMGKVVLASYTDKSAAIKVNAGEGEMERTIDIGVENDGSADFTLSDQNRNKRVFLGGKGDVSVSLELRDKGGKVFYQVPKP